MTDVHVCVNPERREAGCPLRGTATASVWAAWAHVGTTLEGHAEELGGGEAERGWTQSENQPRAVSRACSRRPFIRGVSIDSSRLPTSERHTGAARTKSHCPRVLSSLAEPRELSGGRAGV